MPQKKSFFHGGRGVRFSNLAELPPQRGHTRPGKHHARPYPSTPFPTQTPFSFGEPTRVFKHTRNPKPRLGPRCPTAAHRPGRSGRCAAADPAQPSGSEPTDTAAGGTHGPGQRERPAGPAEEDQGGRPAPRSTPGPDGGFPPPPPPPPPPQHGGWGPRGPGRQNRRSPEPPAGTPRQAKSEHPPAPHRRRPVDGGSRCLG